MIGASVSTVPIVYTETGVRSVVVLLLTNQLMIHT